MAYRCSTILVALLSLAAGSALARGGAPAVMPTPRPQAAVRGPEGAKAPPRPSLTDIPDMSRAVPASEIGRLPTTSERYKALNKQVDQTRPVVERAKTASQALNAEAAKLRQQLIGTAARVQHLEQTKARLDRQIAVLSSKEQVLTKTFARDRVQVAHLLGLLERLQHDAPPVLALTAQDALGAAQGAMLLGASLPRVYGAAAKLARRLDALRRTRAELVARRTESARTAVQLRSARTRLNQLLATKQAEADTAARRYDKLAAKFAVVARQAKDLGQLLRKVASIRADAWPGGGIAVVGVVPGRAHGLRRGALERPVVGAVAPGGIEGVGGARAPGVTFSTQAGAQVVAPADSRVLFAGPYHKTGQVLILEMAGDYDLVLAGLGDLDVRVGDWVLAGEPLGTMPQSASGARLYFEVRHHGKGMSPEPWLQVGLRKAER